MKNALTVLALTLSISGIVVSLAREEVRCYLGLSSLACPPSRDSQSTSAPPANIETAEPAPENSDPPLNRVPEAPQMSKVRGDAFNLPAAEEPADNSPPDSADVPPASAQLPENSNNTAAEDAQAEEYAQPITEPIELEVIPPPEETQP